VAPAARTRPPRRRTGGVLRFLQVLLSVLILIAVPAVALVAAYGVSAGESIDSAVQSLLEDLQRLVK
jgi:hypothetical protein